MPIKIYKADVSPPARGALMALELLGLNYETEDLNVMKGDTRTPEYTALNPEHTIPFLVDGDFKLGDSHAIITYLVSKYGGDKRSTLYPSAVEEKAIIDQRLFLDAGNIFPKFRALVMEVVVGAKRKDVVEKAIDDVKDVLGILEKYLNQREFLAANHLTVADVSLVASISTLETFISLDEFPKLKAWFEKLKKYDWYQKANEPGLKIIRGFFKVEIDKILNQ